MSGMRKPRRLYLLGLAVILVLILSACAAPAPQTGGEAQAPAEEAAAEEAQAPAEESGETTSGRGTDGTLTILYWQAVSIMNPYLSTGTKDYHAASLVLEPLFNYDPEGNLVPVLAEDIPTVENGGIAEDLMSVTWKLKEGVVWSDGTPLTAEDLVFTWQYCTHPETGCSSATSYEGVTNVEAVDDLTVRISFDAPKPFPYNPFGGVLAPILQKAQFENCIGAAAQGCSEQNTYPIGTGPFKVQDFRANDVVTFVVNENYREPDKPHFAEVIFKGGGDAAAAARAVLETGEADYAWNLQVEPQILADMEAAGLGTLVSAFAGNVERILINFTNPSPDLGELRSEWTPEDPNPHPILSDIRVRQALSMAIDRNVIAEQLYGPGGRPTCNILSGPPAVVSTANDACLTQDLEGAAALLEEAGWVDSDGDGVREKDGMRLSLVYVTSTNQVRQKTQALVKQWWAEIGVETELRNVDAAVYFGGDPASPDTLGKFYADVQMFTNGPDNPDPQNYLGGWICTRETPGDNIARAANNWLGNNVERWCSEEYDALFQQLTQATDPEERAQLAMQLNDMLAQQYVNLPLIFRGSVSAYANTLGGIQMNGWDTEEWNIEDWYRIK
ncbi:MAG TPA: peptide ABC transporter substrate-binding protein [Caldilineaceae bacterium]|nr:peptide ABC transporter substrate-binding protein [Caldilineaceae bacterium]